MRRISTSDVVYARVLLSLDVPFERAREMHRIFQKSSELVEILEDPTIDIEKKYNIIDRVFDKTLCNFIKVTVRNNMIYDIRAIYNAYKELYFKSKNFVLANIFSADPLPDEQIANIENFIKKRFRCDGVEFEFTEDKSLIGGFILKVGNFEYDSSISGLINRLKDNIIKK